MKKNSFLFLVAFVLAACGNAQVEKAVNHLTPGSSAITTEQLSVIFEKANVFPNETQLSFAFIKNGAVQFYGIKRTNDTLSFFNNRDRVFEIGSISKVFTSTLLAHFVAIVGGSDQQLHRHAIKRRYKNFI
jgi:CubicO group peptidase (beta-lactamase class C family)